MIRLFRTTTQQQNLNFPTREGLVKAIRLGVFHDPKTGEDYALWTLPSELTGDPVVSSGDPGAEG